jgi:hypothetical protein
MYLVELKVSKRNTTIWGFCDDIQINQHHNNGNIYKFTNADVKIKSGGFEFHYQFIARI